MASTVTIRQRLSLENGGRTVRVSTQQNGVTTSKTVELPEPVRNLRQIANITQLTNQWPSTRVTADEPAAQPADASRDSDQPA